MTKCTRWQAEHDQLIKQQNSYFNPKNHFGLDDNNITYFNLTDVIDIQNNWRQYFGNNIIYFGKHPKIDNRYINHIFTASIIDSTAKAIVIDGDFIIHPDRFNLIEAQKQLLTRNIKAIVYEPEYEQLAKGLQWLLEYFIKAYPVSSFNPNVKLYSVYTLIYGHIEPSYIIDAVISILSQKSSEFYTLEYIFVLDPPCDENKAKIQAILNNYQNYAKFKVICNKNYLNYTGSYLKALRTVRGDLVFNQDIDDLSHPERFYHSSKYLQEHPDIKAVSFVPVKFKHNINNLAGLENYRQSHIDDPLAVWLNANLFFNTISINPQVICLKQEILPKIKLDSAIVQGGLLGGDQYIVSTILHHYPFSIVNCGKVLYFYRVHDHSACNSLLQGFYMIKSHKVDKQEALSTLVNTKKQLAANNILKISKNGGFQKIKDYLLAKNIKIEENQWS